MYICKLLTTAVCAIISHLSGIGSSRISIKIKYMYIATYVYVPGAENLGRA